MTWLPAILPVMVQENLAPEDILCMEANRASWLHPKAVWGVSAFYDQSFVDGQMGRYQDGFSPARTEPLVNQMDLIDSTDQPNAVKGRSPELIGSDAWVIVGDWSEPSAGTLVANNADTAGHGACYGSLPSMYDYGTYELTYTVVITSGAVRPIVYAAGTNKPGTSRSVSGTYTETIDVTTAGGTFSDALLFQQFPADAPLACTITDISLKKVDPFPGFTEAGMNEKFWFYGVVYPMDTSDNAMFRLLNPAASNYCRFYFNDSPLLGILQNVHNTTLNVNLSTSNNYKLNSETGFAGRAETDNFRLALNGQLTSADTSGDLSGAFSELNVGWNGGIAKLNGGLHTLVFGKGDITNEELKYYSRLFT